MNIPAFLRAAPDSLWCEMERSSANPRFHLLNVLWSLWVFATLFFTPVTAAFWWTIALGYPVFLLLFVLIHVRPMNEMGGYVGALAMLAFVSMYWNPSAWTYAVFACVYAGLRDVDSLPARVLRILMIQAVLVMWAWWLGWPWFVMVMAVGVCSSSSFGALLGRVSQVKTAQLRLSHEEVRRLAAMAERERIGRDLHDLLGHTLSLITLKLELSRRLFDRDHEGARRELEEAEHVARHALAEVRAAVTGIRAAGIAAELASARLLLQGSGVEFDYGAPPTDVPDDVERALTLVLREAVTNIHRHARARHAEVEVVATAESVRLCVTDNGRGGIDIDGNGLSGMRERVRALGGTLTVDSPAGRGTRLDVVVPLRQPGRVEAPTRTGGVTAEGGRLLGTSGGTA
ncbi:MAG TPA: sensor histidine kinase [Rhodanobacter sp.]